MVGGGGEEKRDRIGNVVNGARDLALKYPAITCAGTSISEAPLLRMTLMNLVERLFTTGRRPQQPRAYLTLNAATRACGRTAISFALLLLV